MFGWLTKIFGAKDEYGTDFYSSISGVSFKNPDQTSRQKVIREEIRAGMDLDCVPEDNNKHDANAVAVFAPGGRQIGYLNPRLAVDVREWFRKGTLARITVSEVTGGTKDKPTYGVNIRVRVKD